MRKVTRLLAFCFHLLSPFLVSGVNIDSLKKAIQVAGTDSARILLYDQMCEGSDMRILREYSWLEYDLAYKALNKSGSATNFFRKYFALAHNNIGFYFESAGEMDSALVHFEQYAQLSKKNGEMGHYSSALNNIATMLLNLGEVRTALAKYHESYEAAKLSKDTVSIAYSLVNMASIYSNTGDPDSAIIKFIEALRLHRACGNTKGTAQTLLFMGNFHSSIGRQKEGLENLTEAVSLFRKLEDYGGTANALIGLGVILFKQGDYMPALDHFTEALSLNQKIRNKQGIGNTYNSIGSIYKALGYADKALEFMTKGLKLNEEVGDWKSVSNCWLNIGAIYYRFGDPEIKNDLKASYASAAKKAEDCFKKGLSICEKTEDVIGKANAYKHMGNLYSLKIEGVIDLTDNIRALECYRKSREFYRQFHDRQGEATILINESKVKMNMGKFAEAKLEAEQGYNMAQELGYPEMLRNSSEVLSRIYRHTGDYKKALEMHILFKQMSDSLNSENHRKASIQKAFQFEYDKKLAADSVRSLQERKVHELELYREKSQRNFLYAGLGLLITLAGFIFQRFRVTRKQNKIIEEQKKAVDSAYALLHEKNKEVLDSIHYAKRIQDSFLPTNKFLESKLGKK